MNSYLLEGSHNVSHVGWSTLKGQTRKLAHKGGKKQS